MFARWDGYQQQLEPRKFKLYLTMLIIRNGMRIFAI